MNALPCISYLRSFVLCTALLCLSATLSAQENEHVFKIAVTDTPIMSERVADGNYIGFEIDLWYEIARKLSMDFEFVDCDSFAEVLESVASGRADFGISSISITEERSKKMAFSQPYYTTGLTVLTSRTDIAMDAVFKTMFSVTLLKTIGAYILFLFGFGILFWALERKEENDIRHDLLGGVFDGAWYAFKRSRDMKGGFSRLLTLPLWLITMLFTSLIAAQIISSYLLAKQDSLIRTDLDFSEVSLGVLQDTMAEDGVNDIEEEFKSLSSVLDHRSLYKQFREGKFEYVLADGPLIDYFESVAQDEKFEVIKFPGTFSDEYYGIAINYSINWKTIRKIDQMIMHLRDVGYLKKLKGDWGLEDNVLE